MRLLSTDQIRSVCITARRAYDVWEGRDDWEAGHYPLSRTGCFDAWRHRETARIADGEASLRRCISERHYLRLLAHFNDLAGQGGEALRALLRHAEEARIVIFFKLQQALAQKGLDEGYAAHIARCKFKKPLGDCTEKQLWVLFFDVRRAKARGKHLNQSSKSKAQQKREALAAAMKQRNEERRNADQR